MDRLLDLSLKAGVADIVTFNTVLKGHARFGSVKNTWNVVDTLKAAGFRPNHVTYHELLDASLESHPSDVWSIISDMKRSGLEPNRITCSILLKGIQESSGLDIERTLAVVEDVDGDIDEVMLSSVVEACIRVRRTDLLVSLLAKHRSHSAVQIRGAHTYGSLIRAYGALHDMKNVWVTWREMLDNGIAPSSITLGCMVEALVVNGEPEAGYDLVQSVRCDPLFTTEVNAIVYCSILKGFSHKKAFDRVWMLYKEMLEQKVTFSIVTYNALVDACARCQQMSHVPGILEDMLKLGLQPNLITYSTIAKGYCQENKFDRALEVVNSMKATTAFKPDEVLYNSLLDGCARKGLYDRGMALFAEMQEEGVRPSNFTLSVLVKLSSRGKGLEATFTLVEQLKRQFRLRPNTFVYSNLVHACVTHKDFLRAVEVLDQMLCEHVKPDARIYTLLIEHSLKAGNASLTIDLLRASLGLSEGHSRWASCGRVSQPQGGVPAHLVSSTVECLVQRGDQEQRLASLLQDLRRSGHKIDHRSSQRVAGSKSAVPHRRGAGRS